ncbi:hypothetical protein ACFIJ5_10900 [Haloimpatiens sp. FM7330]|uniref:hypothetical protein n=1 Tax=Haloimpatiens sp. FM7330 TaxID=3298610 RepID=UPI003638BD81
MKKCSSISYDRILKYYDIERVDKMSEKRPLGITLIGYFYILGVTVLIITLFTNTRAQFGIAARFGVPNVPENIMRVVVSIITLIMVYGYLKLKKWGYWLMLIDSTYFLIVSIFLSQQYKQQPFYGNVIWSIIVLTYTLSKRKYFNE